MNEVINNYNNGKVQKFKSVLIFTSSNNYLYNRAHFSCDIAFNARGPNGPSVLNIAISHEVSSIIISIHIFRIFESFYFCRVFSIKLIKINIILKSFGIYRKNYRNSLFTR